MRVESSWMRVLHSWQPDSRWQQMTAVVSACDVRNWSSTISTELERCCRLRGPETQRRHKISTALVTLEPPSPPSPSTNDFWMSRIPEALRNMEKGLRPWCASWRVGSLLESDVRLTSGWGVTKRRRSELSSEEQSADPFAGCLSDSQGGRTSVQLVQLLPSLLISLISWRTIYETFIIKHMWRILYWTFWPVRHVWQWQGGTLWTWRWLQDGVLPLRSSPGILNTKMIKDVQKLHRALLLSSWALTGNPSPEFSLADWNSTNTFRRCCQTVSKPQRKIFPLHFSYLTIVHIFIREWWQLWYMEGLQCLEPGKPWIWSCFVRSFWLKTSLRARHSPSGHQAGVDTNWSCRAQRTPSDLSGEVLLQSQELMARGRSGRVFAILFWHFWRILDDPGIIWSLVRRQDWAQPFALWQLHSSPRVCGCQPSYRRGNT